MSHETFRIMSFAPGWKLIKPNGDSQQFAFKVDAEEAALRLADRARARGEAAAVLVQSALGGMTALNNPRS